MPSEWYMDITNLIQGNKFVIWMQKRCYVTFCTFIISFCEIQNINIGRTYPKWSFNPKRLIFVALCNDLIDYVLNISVNTIMQCVHFKSSLIYGSWWDRGCFMKKLSFQHYLQHYSGTTRTTEIQSCLYVHRQVYCDKMSSGAIKSYKY